MDEATEDKSKPRSELDKLVDTLLSSLQLDPSTRNSIDQILITLGTVIQQIPAGFTAAFKTMTEFLQELTNIKGVEVQLKNWKVLDVQLHTMKDTEVPIKHDLGGMSKIESLHIGKRMHMAAEIGEFNKDYLKVHVYEGMTIAVTVPLLGRQQVALKGSARLSHDEKKQLVIVFNALVPGTDLPFTVAVPVRNIIDELRKSTAPTK